MSAGAPASVQTPRRAQSSNAAQAAPGSGKNPVLHWLRKSSGCDGAPEKHPGSGPTPEATHTELAQ
jgi:hypothetical protein